MAEPDDPPHDLGRLVEVLDRHGVDYLLVGGVAALAYGANRPTEDADCVVRRELQPRSAGGGTPRARRQATGGRVERRGGPTTAGADRRRSAGVGRYDDVDDRRRSLRRAGRLEGADGRLVPYEELVERAAVVEGRGVAMRIAGLDDVIAAKERAGRPKDAEALPELRALRDHRDKGRP